jgi:small nuclear ribonucleoprotein (snRNP)-like protein
MIDLEQFVGKSVIVTRGNGTTREGIVERTDHLIYPYKLEYLDGNLNTYTRDGYFWSYKTPDILNIKSIKLKEEESMIDLEEFVNKTVVVTREDGNIKEGVIERSDTFSWPYKLVYPDGIFNTYTKDGYYWVDKIPCSVNIKSIKLKEGKPMIDLEQFVNKTVVVTREDGITKEGVIERNDNPTFPYKFRYPDGSRSPYTRDGYFWPYKGPSPANIKSIKLKEESLEQRLETIQREAELIKQQLKQSFPSIQDANPGDLLEDGTVVIEKYTNAALIAAPRTTEVHCQWSKEFTQVRDKLKEHGLNPSQWFIPSQKQLALAYKNAKSHFPHLWHWSSTQEIANNACIEELAYSASSVDFFNGRQGRGDRTVPRFVRAFRLVEL